MNVYRSCLMLVALAITFVGHVYADTTDFSVYKMGVQLMKEGKWDHADRIFTTLLDEQPKHGDAFALRGISRYRLERYQAAEKDLRTALKLKTHFPARTLYYMGITRSKMGHREAAAEAFEELLSDYPDSIEARKVGPLPEHHAPPTADVGTIARDEVILSLDSGLDTNPARVSGGDSDIFLAAYARGALRVVPIELVLGADLYYEKYLDDSDNDFMSLRGDASREFELSRDSSIEPALSIKEVWSAGEAYETQLAVEATHRQDWGPDWKTEARLRYRQNSSQDDSFDHSDSDDLAFRGRLAKFHGQAGMLRRTRGLLEWTSNSADLDYLGYDSLAIGVECRLAIMWETSLDLAITHETREYAAFNPDYLMTRDDSSITLDATAWKPLSDRLYGRTQLSYFTRDSNIDYYQADEVRFSAGAVYVW